VLTQQKAFGKIIESPPWYLTWETFPRENWYFSLNVDEKTQRDLISHQNDTFFLFEAFLKKLFLDEICISMKT